jgi:hypothetical protein
MIRTRLAVIIFCLLLPFQTFAQESSAVKDKNDIDRILELIPIKQTLNELPQELKNQFSQNPFGITTSKNEQLIKLFDKAYDTDSLSNSAHQSFEENFDHTYSDSVLAMLKSDTIKPILKSEANFHTIQGTRKQIVTKYELEQDEPSQKRISIIKDLIERRSAREFGIESQTILFRSLVIGTDTISSRLSLSEAQVTGIVNNFNNRLQMQLEDELTNNYLVMYRELSDRRLKKYVDFYTTEAGTELKESLNKAIQAAFQEASDRFISSVESL